MGADESKIREHKEIEEAIKARDNLEAAVSALPEIQKGFKQLREELCEGPNCLKNEVKNGLLAMDEKIKKIEEGSTGSVCKICGYNGIKPLTSYCPECGSGIPSWEDEKGEPIPGWVPYWDRPGAITHKELEQK